MDYKWTRKGLVVEVTNRVNGLLEQGGICGQVLFYPAGQIAKLGYHRGDDLEQDANDYVSKLEMIMHHLQPRVLRKGTRIE